MAEEKKGMDTYRRLELIQCPRCGKTTLEYSHRENQIHYVCVNPKCDYMSQKTKGGVARENEGVTLTLILVIAIILVLAVAGVSAHP